MPNPTRPAAVTITIPPESTTPGEGVSPSPEPQDSPSVQHQAPPPAHGLALRPLETVIPSCTDQFLSELLVSMENSEPGSTMYVIVGDNGLSDDFKKQWPTVRFIEIKKPFVFAKAINAMVAVADKTADIFILNDDTEVKTIHWRTILQMSLAKHRPEQWGMLSVQIDGGVGNPELEVRGLNPTEVVACEKSIMFVAVAIPREVWTMVGGLDETFVGYGFDDDDYTRRTKMAGFKCGVMGGTIVSHGKGGFKHSSSYARMLGQAEWNRVYEFNARMFAKKYGTQAVANRLCLNIGCGDSPRHSEMLDKWLNLDIQDLPGVDIVRDIRRGIPMPDESFDHVLADNMLEHFASEDVIFIINEIDRVLKIGGTAEIVVPHALIGQGQYQDPTHKSYFVPRSCIYWNQVMSTRGGKFVGITANLLPWPDIAKGVQTFGDPSETEVFLRFILKKHPLPEKSA